MTDELPKRRPTDPVYCSDCTTDLVIERDDDDIVLRCACGTKRAAEVKQDLPEGWE